MEYLEIAPGVAVLDGQLKFCPGCGMGEVGGDPTDPEDVLAWFLAVFACLTTQGARGYTEAKATELANRYIAKPWHAHTT